MEISTASACFSPTPGKWDTFPMLTGHEDFPVCSSSSPPRNLKKFRRWQCEQVRALRGEAKSSWKRLVGVESACNVDCRFKLSTHKMLFIVNSEDYMYRRGTLCRAKQVPTWLRGPEAWGLAMGLREGVCPQVPIPDHLGGVRSQVPTDPPPSGAALTPHPSPLRCSPWSCCATTSTSRSGTAAGWRTT